ncbi:MAG: hypothetical protein O2780_09810 [Proteobacteria bacterium]|nr:hypothetical protein [Pseudomonadota bacterium]MDA1298557.1 hypothetical protein [Pseudomonadota bacterium]
MRGESRLEQEVADCYRGYHEAFVEAGRTGDVMPLMAFTHLPLVAVAGANVNVFEEAEAGEARWSRIIDDLPEDYGYSVAHETDVTMISSTSALITVQVSRYKRSGDEYGRFRQSYIAVKGSEGWQIAIWLVHDSMDSLSTRRF